MRKYVCEVNGEVLVGSVLLYGPGVCGGAWKLGPVKKVQIVLRI